MKWARRVIIGSSLAVGSMAFIPGVAGAASCVTPATMSEPSCVVTPTIAATAEPSSLPYTASPSSATPAGTATTTSLPFTGADVEELAIVGAGAVLAGGLLIRRRRRIS
jgi:LPXTG-motif cell wall-anchored protein